MYKVDHTDHSTLADQDLRTCNKVKARVCPQNTRYLNVDVDGCLVASLRTICVIGPEMKITSLTFICTIPYKVFPNFRKTCLRFDKYKGHILFNRELYLKTTS